MISTRLARWAPTSGSRPRAPGRSPSWRFMRWKPPCLTSPGPNCRWMCVRASGARPLDVTQAAGNVGFHRLRGSSSPKRPPDADPSAHLAGRLGTPGNPRQEWPSWAWPRSRALTTEAPYTGPVGYKVAACVGAAGRIGAASADERDHALRLPVRLGGTHSVQPAAPDHDGGCGADPGACWVSLVQRQPAGARRGPRRLVATVSLY